jgi:N-acetylglucosamine-6-sulfatase
MIDTEYRRRAQSVKAVDRLLASIELTLAAHGQLSNTYIVFSSDNGYHMGQHRLLPGKETAFDSDIHVPLIVTGPGVTAGRVVYDVVQNTDLDPTFLQLAGSRLDGTVDGSSLVPLLHARPSTPSQTWPTVALIEHHGPDHLPDPDFENGDSGGNPSSYEAIRAHSRRLGDVVYVEYTKTHGREFYDLSKDPFERNNTYALLSAARRAELHRVLVRLERCHGARSCWTAAQPRPQ